MRDRLLLRALPALALVTLAACTLPGRDGAGGEATADSAATTVALDTTAATAGDSTAVPAAGPTGDSVGGAQVPPAGGAEGPAAQPGVVTAAGGEQANPPSQAIGSLEQQVEQLLQGQAAINQRLDSIAAGSAGAAGPVGAAATGRAAGAAGTSGQVLDQAGQSVQNFGVGIIWSAIVIIIFNLTIRGSVWLLDALSERNPGRRLFYKRLVPIVRIVLWIFAAYLIIRVIFQVDAQGLFAAAAAVGVAVGFAAQDLIKNLFGGLILVFDQPFQVGDKVSVGGTYGEVVSIGLRSTRMVTPDDNLVSVPNSQVVDQQVANANAGELNCQVVTDLYLPGWADEDAAKRIAFNAAASSKYVYLNKPIVTLVSDQFKETFLTRVRVKAYVMDPRLEFLFQSDVTERARAGFREAGLLRPEHMRMDLVERSSVRDVADEQDVRLDTGGDDHDRA